MRSFISMLLFCLPFYLIAQNSTNALVSKIEEIVQDKVANQNFSGVVLVADQGEPIFNQAYGLAYRQSNIPIQKDYHFSIASITKLFTSIIILQLEQEGKLMMNQCLDTWFPDWKLPNQSKITPHHLLLHISGLADEPNKLYHQFYSNEEMIQLSQQKAKRDQFGDFNYNNVDYFILGAIIEKLENKPWAEVVKDRILQPLGMTETGFLKYGYYPKRFSYTYSVSKKGKYTQDPLFYIQNFGAAGNMYSTATDLLLLDQALYSNTLLGEEAILKLSKSYPEYNYTGYSVWNYQYPFIENKPMIMERRGGILGANVVLIRLTEQNKT
ncbi:MAG: serine hydrolase domain-containing protein, partial [Bacteroidota bacterium]